MTTPDVTTRPLSGGSGRRRPTVAHVASEAGVSVATAGRVIGGYGNVRADRRAKVEAAVQRLGYSPNGVARSMRSGGTGQHRLRGCGHFEPVLRHRHARGL
jgi:Bacterial regulatory proteins, lacI family